MWWTEDSACSLSPSERMPRCRCTKDGVGGVLASSGALPVARTAARAAGGRSAAVCQTGALEMTARRACTTRPPTSRTPVSLYHEDFEREKASIFDIASDMTRQYKGMQAAWLADAVLWTKPLPDRLCHTQCRRTCRGAFPR